ncbi:hypothetical protein C8J57DRAFT_1249791 [Mycena rebaudengoi]|nr:hypothetical protein C8J57DRAFT_1249791 [Mycena rebaudengoi]
MSINESTAVRAHATRIPTSNSNTPLATGIPSARLSRRRLPAGFLNVQCHPRGHFGFLFRLLTTPGSKIWSSRPIYVDHSRSTREVSLRPPPALSQSIYDDYHRTQRNTASTCFPTLPYTIRTAASAPFSVTPTFLVFFCVSGSSKLLHSTYCTPKIHASRLFRPANSTPIERHRGTPTLCFQRPRSESVSTEARGRSICGRIERLWDLIRASALLPPSIPRPAAPLSSPSKSLPRHQLCLVICTIILSRSYAPVDSIFGFCDLEKGGSIMTARYRPPHPSTAVDPAAFFRRALTIV